MLVLVALLDDCDVADNAKHVIRKFKYVYKLYTILSGEMPGNAALAALSCWVNANAI